MKRKVQNKEQISSEGKGENVEKENEDQITDNVECESANVPDTGETDTDTQGCDPDPTEETENIESNTVECNEEANATIVTDHDSRVDNPGQSIDKVEDAESEELDFEPDMDEDEVISENEEIKGGSTEVSESHEKVESAQEKTWLDNVASPSKVSASVTEDLIQVSDTDDIDELGDKIDAACPANIDDEDSDDEKRGWRSEKNTKNLESSDKRVGRDRRRSPRRRSPRRRSPAKRRKISPPRSLRNRSSSIEILCERSTSRSPKPRRGRKKDRSVDRLSLLSNGRFISRSRSRSYGRRASYSPIDTMADLKETRDRTNRIVGARRQMEDLREKFIGNTETMRGNVHNRLGNTNDRSHRKRSPEPVGFKLIVKNFPSAMSESEFYSMFVRKGEIHKCEMKKNIGFVTYKTRMGAENAKKTLDGTKNGSQTLSVVDAPGQRHLNSRSYDQRPQAPSPPRGIFSRVGHQNQEHRGGYGREGFREHNPRRFENSRQDRHFQDGVWDKNTSSNQEDLYTMKNRMDSDFNRVNMMERETGRHMNESTNNFCNMDNRMEDRFSGNVQWNENRNMNRVRGMSEEMMGGLRGMDCIMNRGMVDSMDRGMDGNINRGIVGNMNRGMDTNRNGDRFDNMERGMDGNINRGMGRNMIGEIGNMMGRGMGHNMDQEMSRCMVDRGMNREMSGGMSRGIRGYMGGNMEDVMRDGTNMDNGRVMGRSMGGDDMYDRGGGYNEGLERQMDRNIAGNIERNWRNDMGGRGVSANMDQNTDARFEVNSRNGLGINIGGRGNGLGSNDHSRFNNGGMECSKEMGRRWDGSMGSMANEFNDDSNRRMSGRMNRVMDGGFNQLASNEMNTRLSSSMGKGMNDFIPENNMTRSNQGLHERNDWSQNNMTNTSDNFSNTNIESNQGNSFSGGISFGSMNYSNFQSTKAKGLDMDLRENDSTDNYGSFSGRGGQTQEPPRGTWSNSGNRPFSGRRY